MTQPDTPPATARILVVDDTPANLRLLKRILSEQNYTVLAANSGEAALQFLETSIPDLILLDVMMPGIDGYEVCRRLKSAERTRDVPVIFISAMDATWDKVKAFSAGGVDYVVKPIEEAELLARLETHLSLASLRKHLEHRVEERTAELKKARDALLENQRLLQAIIDGSQTLVYVKDLDGRYMMINQRFRELFSHAGPPENQTAHAIFPQEVADRIREMDERVVAAGHAIEAEMLLPHADGMHTYIAMKSPLRDLNGEIYAVCAIATDITQRVREEAALRELNDLLESRLAERLSGDSR